MVVPQGWEGAKIRIGDDRKTAGAGVPRREGEGATGKPVHWHGAPYLRPLFAVVRCSEGKEGGRGNDGQRFGAWRWAGVSALMFIRRTALSATTKLSAEHETSPIANVLLAAVLFVLNVPTILSLPGHCFCKLKFILNTYKVIYRVLVF